MDFVTILNGYVWSVRSMGSVKSIIKVGVYAGDFSGRHFYTVGSCNL